VTTYREFQAELQRLHEQAESARRQEKAAALERIRALIVEYQLLPSDFGFAGSRRSKSSSVAKYRDPASGATWSGKGRAPRWIVDKDRAAFEIK